MNCMGPTARSCVRVAVVRAVVGVVDRREAVAVEHRAEDRGDGGAVGVDLPPRAWPDSTLPIAASSCQGRLQPGLDSRERRLGLLVRVQDGGGYAGLGAAGAPGRCRGRRRGRGCSAAAGPCSTASCRSLASSSDGVVAPRLSLPPASCGDAGGL